MVSAILIYSSALTPEVPVNRAQLTLFCRMQEGTEVRSWGLLTLGLQLVKPQFSCLENDFSKSLTC